VPLVNRTLIVQPAASQQSSTVNIILVMIASSEMEMSRKTVSIVTNACYYGECVYGPEQYWN
jgi:hypothetical protein